jgi:hypothetical protein
MAVHGVEYEVIVSDVINKKIKMYPFKIYPLPRPDSFRLWILQQISGFADKIFGYFAVLQQMSGFA